MSTEVELLRRAAALMREDADRRWWVVADWLDRAANGIENLPPCRRDRQAAKVARTYLGEVRDALDS